MFTSRSKQFTVLLNSFSEFEGRSNLNLKIKSINKIENLLPIGEGELQQRENGSSVGSRVNFTATPK